MGLVIACVRPSSCSLRGCSGTASLPSDTTVSMLGDPEKSNPLALALPLLGVHSSSSSRPCACWELLPLDLRTSALLSLGYHFGEPLAVAHRLPVFSFRFQASGCGLLVDGNMDHLRSSSSCDPPPQSDISAVPQGAINLARRPS